MLVHNAPRIAEQWLSELQRMIRLVNRGVMEAAHAGAEAEDTSAGAD